jgi:hypothetical protein
MQALLLDTFGERGITLTNSTGIAGDLVAESPWACCSRWRKNSTALRPAARCRLAPLTPWAYYSHKFCMWSGTTRDSSVDGCVPVGGQRVGVTTLEVSEALVA